MGVNPIGLVMNELHNQCNSLLSTYRKIFLNSGEFPSFNRTVSDRCIQVFQRLNYVRLSRYQESIIYKFGKIEPERVVAPVVINAPGTKVVFLIINHNPLSRGVALRKTLGDVAIQVELKLDDTSFANMKFASITYWRVNREGQYTCDGFCDVEPTAGRVIDRYAGAKPDGWVDQIYDTGKINYSKMFIDILTTPATTFVDYGFYYTKV